MPVTFAVMNATGMTRIAVETPASAESARRRHRSGPAAVSTCRS